MTTPRDSLEAEVNRQLAERISRLRGVLEGALADISNPLLVTPVEVPDYGSLLSPIRGFLEASRAAGTQKEVLRALLEASSACYARTALFILRSGTLVFWESRNSAAVAGLETGAVDHLTIPAGGDHLPARALASGGLVLAGPEGPGFLLTEAFGGVVPPRSAAVPLIVRGRAAAILYGDTGRTDSPGHEAAFAILGQMGGLSIEALASSRRPRTGGAHRVNEAGRAGSAGTDEVRWTGSPPASRDTMAGAEVAMDGLESGDLASQGDQPGTAMAPPAPEEAEMQALLGDIEGMRRAAGDGGLAPDEQRLHADARRFASLLISEILLYNEEAVILGRRNRDLARRLAKEINKSRQAFSTRVPGYLPDVSRYFDEELLRVLAEGDSAALGV